MGPLQKIYELFSKLGDIKIMLYPLMVIFAMVGGAIYFLIDKVGTFGLIAIVATILIGGGAYCYYVYIRPWLAKRRLEKAAAAAEAGEVEEEPEISDDEFRLVLKEKFAKGVADLAGFRKDADKLPLYLVVGEKGCGKSEAIRRSGIGFPAGLTNTSQGVGGTEVLDWWITNRSVLLDLPGAHFFGRGGKSEAKAWKHLLKHIADFRPASPLNGIILTISVEQLLADSDEDMNAKAARLVEHFENIHRALGTQVPVFVLVTKSDRLCGFLEYFSDVNEQGGRDQMFGWSSGTDLEAPFDLDQYRADIGGIYNRLRQRRDSLLQYSIESKSLAYKRRVQVNHLYEFPRSFKSTADRLGLYLEQIFEPNSWYCDPFFLRGAFYTSAIQRETELDPSLARALEKPLADLPAAEARHTEDSYFLKETLNDKVFCEGGLVTWKQDPRYQRKRSRARLALAAVVVLLAFVAYTWWVSNDWRQRMAGKQKDWKAVQRWLPQGDDIVATNAGGTSTYNGGLAVTLEDITVPETYGDGNEVALYRLPEMLAEGWIEEVDTPIIFSPIDLFNRKLKTDMDISFQDIFESRYVVPLVVRTEERILSEEEQWTEEGTHALGQLLRMEAMSVDKGPKLGSEERVVNLDSLFRYVLDDLSLYAQHKNSYGNYVRDIYHGEIDASWPPEALVDEEAIPVLEKATTSGVEQFKKAMDYYVSKEGEAFSDLRLLLDALVAFRDGESLLWKNALASGDPDSVHQIDVILESWYRDVGKLTERRKALDEVLVTLFNDEDVNIELLCDRIRDRVVEHMENQYFMLLKELESVAVALEGETAEFHIQDVKSLLTGYRAESKALIKTEVDQYLADFESVRADREYLALTDYQDFRRYQLRNHVYGFLQSSEYVVGEDVYDPFDYLLDLEELQKSFDQSVREIGDFDTNSDSFGSGREAADKILSLIYRQQRYKVVEQIVQALPITTSDFARMVASRVEAQWLERPEIPLTAQSDMQQFDDGYNTEVVYDLLSLWGHMDEILRKERLGKDSLPDVERLKRSFKEKDQVFNQYLTEYLNYWTRTVDQNTEMVQYATWKDFHAELSELEVYNVNHKLRILYETALYALGIVPSTQPGQTDALLDLTLKMKGLTEDFDAECLRVLNAWKSIEKVDRDVMNEILLLSAEDFKKEYLSLLDNNVNKANFGFWNSLCTQAVRLLADEGEHLSRYYLVNLATRYRGFPLINDIATPALTPESFDEALELVRHIKQVPKEDNPDTMMGGDRTGWPDVDKELDRLQGGKVLRTEYERDWFEQIVKVMDFIEGDTPLTCELVILPRETQEVRPPRFPAPRPTSKVFGGATWVYRYMRINGEAFNTEPTTYVVGHEGKTYPMAPAANKLAMHFYYTSEDMNPGVNSFARPSGVAGLEMEWLPLVVLHMGDSVVLEDKMTCAVPFRVVDNAEHKDSEYFYWIGFRFNKEIPDIKAWPSPYNWPHMRRSPHDLGGFYPEDTSDENYLNPVAPLLPLAREVSQVEPVQTNASMNTVSDKIKQVMNTTESAPAETSRLSEPRAQLNTLPAPDMPSHSLASDDDYLHAPALPAEVPEAAVVPRQPVAAQAPRKPLYSPAAGQSTDTIYRAPRPEKPKAAAGYSPSDRNYAPPQIPVMTPPAPPTPPGPVSSPPVVEAVDAAAPTVPVVKTGPIRRNPPIVPAPERPLYTTEVTFTPPRPGKEGPTPPGGNAVIGTEAPEVQRDPVATPYVVSPGGGYEAVKESKKKNSPADAESATAEGGPSLTLTEVKMSESPGNGGDRRFTNPSIVNQFNKPKVVVQRGVDQPAKTNALPIVFDILFDEPVLDFPTGTNVGGIEFSGTAAGLHYVVEGDRATYRVTVKSIAQDGMLAVAVPAGLSADLFGNANIASNTEGAEVYYDATRPRCVIQSDQQGVMNEGNMTITLAFSEPVFGLRDGALHLENATVERVAGTDGDDHYVFTVSPRADGTTALAVPEDAVFDAVGNGNLPSAAFSLIVDSTGPDVALSSFETPHASNSWVMRVHARFSEPVLHFDRAAVAIQGGSLMNFTPNEDGTEYLFDVRPAGGEVRIQIPAGATTDLIGNPNNASEVFMRQIDRDRPTVAFSVMGSDGRSDGGTLVEVTFSEPVFGVEADMLRVGRGSALRIAGKDGDASYRYVVMPAGNRSVELRISANTVADLAGNGNKSATFRVDVNRPPATQTEDESGKAAPPIQ